MYDIQDVGLSTLGYWKSARMEWKTIFEMTLDGDIYWLGIAILI